jgi:hypothetical protein
MKTIIYIGGFYHIAFAVFHLLFWRLFDWKNDLRQLSFINRGVMQILNLRIIYVFLAIAFLSFFFAENLLSTVLGKAIMTAISLFWLMRAAEQIVFFGLRKAASALIFLVFLFGAGVYLFPVLF